MSIFDPRTPPYVQIAPAPPGAVQYVQELRITQSQLHEIFGGTDPAAVFKLTAPLKEMFVDRNPEIQQALVDAIREPGRQIILYGPTGIGKTSLVERLLADMNLKFRNVASESKFDSLVRAALGEMGLRLEVERTDEVATTAQAEIGIPQFLKSLVKGSRSKQTKTAPIPKSLQAQLVEGMEGAGYRVLVLDNYENVRRGDSAPDVGRALSGLLKWCADRAGENEEALKIVVIGIPSDAEDLVQLDEAAARRTAQLEVTPMTPQQVGALVDRGGGLLGRPFHPACRRAIIRYSDGYPWLATRLSLSAARHLEIRSRVEYQERVKRYGTPTTKQARAAWDAVMTTCNEITVDDFEAGLPSLVRDCRLQIGGEIDQVMQDERLRAVLVALALNPEGEVPIETLLDQAKERLTRPINSGVDDAVRDLSDRFRILQECSVTDGTSRAYRFTNPLTRVYVWLSMRNSKLIRSRMGAQKHHVPEDLLEEADPWVADANTIMYEDRSLERPEINSATVQKSVSQPDLSFMNTAVTQGWVPTASYKPVREGQYEVVLIDSEVKAKTATGSRDEQASPHPKPKNEARLRSTQRKKRR